MNVKKFIETYCKKCDQGHEYKHTTGYFDPLIFCAVISDFENDKLFSVEYAVNELVKTNLTCPCFLEKKDSKK